MKNPFQIPAFAGLARLVAPWTGLGLLGAGLLVTGCTGFPQAGPGSYHPSPAQLQAGLHLEDHYIYYPGYEIYYNPRQGHYAYRTDRGWVEQIEPPKEVGLRELLESPSVAMTFQDNPASHHAQVTRDYPRNWGLNVQPTPRAR